MENNSQLRQIIQEEIRKHSSGSRFGLNSIPRHVHNNVDSPFVLQPILTYGGIVVSSGISSFLPKGWLSESNGTIGSYNITHNLSNPNYFVVASAFQSTNVFASPVIEIFENSFTISWGGASLGDTSFARKATSFCFLLVVINNRSPQIPLYSGINAP